MTNISETHSPKYKKRIRWVFLVLTLVMIVQLGAHLKGSEPYPAIIHPSFGRVPGKEGRGTYSKPEVYVSLRNGDTVDVNYREMFNRVRPWMVIQIYKMMERKASGEGGQVRRFSLGTYSYELRRFLRHDTTQYLGFKNWTQSRVKALLGDVDAVSVTFAHAGFHYELNEFPVKLTRSSTHIFHVVVLDEEAQE